MTSKTYKSMNSILKKEAAKYSEIFVSTHPALALSQSVLRIFALPPLGNLHHFLIFSLAFSV
jgi:hypothetical protein